MGTNGQGAGQNRAKIIYGGQWPRRGPKPGQNYLWGPMAKARAKTAGQNDEKALVLLCLVRGPKPGQNDLWGAVAKARPANLTP